MCWPDSLCRKSCSTECLCDRRHVQSKLLGLRIARPENRRARVVAACEALHAVESEYRSVRASEPDVRSVTREALDEIATHGLCSRILLQEPANVLPCREPRIERADLLLLGRIFVEERLPFVESLLD